MSARNRGGHLSNDLTVRFLGVRGSIATPGAELSAGGNTSCVEVVAGDTRIVLDAGTGLRRSATSAWRGGPRHSTILLSHLHWDHIQGLPFFTPIYVPGHRVEIVSGPNGVMPLDDALRQMFGAVLPGRLRRMSAARSRRASSAPTRRFTIGDVTITMAKLNHPDPVYGYRLEHGGQSIVYATDTEHFACVDPTLEKLAAGADVLIYDAQYTPEEYPTKVGWGHSTWEAGAELARAAGVPQLVLFHHDPHAHRRRSSRRSRREARAALPGTVAAREGVVLVLRDDAERAGRRGLTGCQARAMLANRPACRERRASGSSSWPTSAR